jgi:protein tyrosine phosphatase (PTP) superfamily phosphohydrolase (DUF442 family)
MGMISPIAIGRVFVGEEPDDDDIYALAESGFRAIVCLSRPPVGAEGPTADIERAAADVTGLAFLRIAVPADGLSAATVRAFRESVRVLPRPIYVHCGFGDRAAALALVAEAGQLADPAGKIDELHAHGIRLPPALLAEVARLRTDEIIAG